MATAHSRSSFDPPTSALPPLPVTRTRKSLPTLSEIRLPSVSQIPSRPTIRSPSKYTRFPVTPSTFHAKSTPNVPTLRTLSSAARREASPPGKDLRRTISIPAFPQPPKTSARPVASPSLHSPMPSIASQNERRDSSGSSGSGTPNGTIQFKRPRVPRKPTNQSCSTSSIPSFLNGNGANKAVSSAPSAVGPDGLLNLPSPPHSRSSSAQGSYSTSATTFEDIDENNRRGREPTEEIVGAGRQSKYKEGKGNVIVSVRIRPDTAGSNDMKSEGEWMVDGRRSLVAYKGREGGDYFYDNVFATHDKNNKVYDASAKRLVRRVMEGYHGTVFAYGMTGTGKTFSMQGTASSPGVIPQAITDIFSYIRETPHREFLLRVSYLEIYNEKIHDLLSQPTAGGIGIGSMQQEEIKLREDSKRGVYATPLKEEIVQSPTQLLRVIARGDAARRTSSTQFNARSSRSHAVVQIVVESRDRASASRPMPESSKATSIPGGVRVSTLSLIDLAGSERAAENKERRTEGAHINKSLLTLGTVIARLSGDRDSNGNPTDKDGKHLPYRDSKLTRLLQPALSGNSLVSILCTIQIGSTGSAAVAISHVGETLNTLKFAARAKNNIVSFAKKQEASFGSGPDAGSKVLLERYRMEIQNLRGQLEGQAKTHFDEEEKQLEKEAEQRHEEQMLEMQLARTALKERIEHLNRLILTSKSYGVNTSDTFSSPSNHQISPTLSNGDPWSRSVRSSASQSTLGPSISRNISVSSAPTLNGQIGNGQSLTSSNENGIEEEDSVGEFGDGTASSKAHIRALQADLVDKNRYISTLEKRLLQARRSSQSRTTLAFSARGSGEDSSSATCLLQEKDAEIADLRARLDDKDRMLTALRSAARKRDVADVASDGHGSWESTWQSAHRAQESNGSGTAMSPVELLLPQNEKDKNRKSVDELSRVLDEMISDRVESGHMLKSKWGSVRPIHERKKESLGAVPGIGALTMSLRASTLSEAEAPAA